MKQHIAIERPCRTDGFLGQTNCAIEEPYDIIQGNFLRQVPDEHDCGQEPAITLNLRFSILPNHGATGLRLMFDPLLIALAGRLTGPVPAQRRFLHGRVLLPGLAPGDLQVVVE